MLSSIEDSGASTSSPPTSGYRKPARSVSEVVTSAEASCSLPSTFTRSFEDYERHGGRVNFAYEDDEDDDEQEERIAETKDVSKKPSNRPTRSNFRQQRLEAWQPILTASTVIPSLLVIGLTFIPVGYFLLMTSESVQEVIHDYTDCRQDGASTCDVDFELKESFTSNVYLYFVLSPYFQNHRRYANSYDSRQVGRGEYSNLVDSHCAPIDYDGNGKPIAPCGMIANSLFNDSFSLTLKDGKKKADIRINRTDISWPTDTYKYTNPKDDKIWEKWGKPPNWPVSADLLDSENPSNNGFINEALMVWMRVGAFPTVKKLYGRLYTDRQGHFEKGLPAGNYSMRIAYRYPVTEFGGRKSFVISTVSWMGGKSNFLAVAYMTVGSIVVLLAAFLFVVHRKYGMTEEEFVNIHHDTPYTTRCQ